MEVVQGNTGAAAAAALSATTQEPAPAAETVTATTQAETTGTETGAATAQAGTNAEEKGADTEGAPAKEEIHEAHGLLDEMEDLLKDAGSHGIVAHLIERIRAFF